MADDEDTDQDKDAFELAEEILNEGCPYGYVLIVFQPGKESSADASYCCSLSQARSLIEIAEKSIIPTFKRNASHNS